MKKMTSHSSLLLISISKIISDFFNVSDALLLFYAVLDAVTEKSLQFRHFGQHVAFPNRFYKYNGYHTKLQPCINLFEHRATPKQLCKAISMQFISANFNDR